MKYPRTPEERSALAFAREVMREQVVAAERYLEDRQVGKSTFNPFGIAMDEARADVRKARKALEIINDLIPVCQECGVNEADVGGSVAYCPACENRILSAPVGV